MLGATRTRFPFPVQSTAGIQLGTQETGIKVYCTVLFSDSTTHCTNSYPRSERERITGAPDIHEACCLQTVSSGQLNRADHRGTGQACGFQSVSRRQPDRTTPSPGVVGVLLTCTNGGDDRGIKLAHRVKFPCAALARTSRVCGPARGSTVQQYCRHPAGERVYNVLAAF